MGKMLYCFIFLLVQVVSIAQSNVLRPHRQINQASNLDIYYDLVRLNDEMQNCNSNCSSNTLPGSGQANPKEKSTQIAMSAAEDAINASDSQTQAAEAAAATVRNQMAQKAIQAARSAEAALAGKQQIVLELEAQQNEAGAAIKEVSASLQNTRINAELAACVANNAQLEVDGLKALIGNAMKNLSKIQGVSSASQAALVEKTQFLAVIRNQFECLCKKIEEAKQDVVKTKKNAYKAVCAAVEATSRAAKGNDVNVMQNKSCNGTPSPICGA